jgi:hypothetical protein
LLLCSRRACGCGAARRVLLRCGCRKTQRQGENQRKNDMPERPVKGWVIGALPQKLLKRGSLVASRQYLQQYPAFRD